MQKSDERRILYLFFSSFRVDLDLSGIKVTGHC